MTERNDIDALAAEYVLGTLELAERESVANRRGSDPVLDAAIRDWERRLAPLNEMAPPVEPRPENWARLSARIDQLAPAASSNIIELAQRVARWRRIAIAASAIAASLLVFVAVREFGGDPAPQRYVAVFQKDDASPAFLLSIDLASRQLTIRPVAAQAPPGKTYQLWIAAAPTGGRPQSLGLVDQTGLSTRTALASFDPATVQVATFGVSLEPAGGSPTGQPTGPVFHAKLLPATP